MPMAMGAYTTAEHHTLTETSTVSTTEPAGLSSRILYRSPHLAVSHRVARINVPTPCFMRGPGEAPGLFALEIALDELACSIEVDPVKLRVRNHADIEQASGMPDVDIGICWNVTGTLPSRFGWHERVPASRAMRRNGLLIGWGMATATYPGRRMPAGCRTTLSDTIWSENTFVTHKTPVGCGATVTVDGVASFSSATHEIGNGVRTVMTQIAADASGLPRDRILFLSGDSAFPDAPYSGASQTSATVGSAVYEAATELKRRLIGLAIQDASLAAVPVCTAIRWNLPMAGFAIERIPHWVSITLSS